MTGPVFESLKGKGAPMVSVFVVLALIALILTIVSAVGYCPVWIPVLFLCIIELIRVLPLGR